MRTLLLEARPQQTSERTKQGRRLVLPVLGSSLVAFAGGLSFSLPRGATPGSICGGGRLQPRARHAGASRAALPEVAEVLLQQLGGTLGAGAPAGAAAAEAQLELPELAASLQQWAEAHLAALPDHLLSPVPPAYAADALELEPPPKLDPAMKYLYGVDGEVLIDPMSKKPMVDDWWNAFVGFQSGLVRGIDQQLRNLGVKEAFGWSVVIYTTFIKCLLYPTISGPARTTALMSLMGPKIKELQETYKDNEQALKRRLDRMYTAFSFSPLGGCFPVLVQFPVIIALYSIWRRLCAEKFEHYAEPWLWVPSLAQPNPQWDMKLDWLFAFDGSDPIIGWNEYLRYLILPVILISYCFYTTILAAPPGKEKETSAVMAFLPWFSVLLITWISAEFPQVALVYYATNYFTNALLTEFAKRELRKEFPMLELFEKTGQFPEGNFNEIVFGPETLHEACKRGSVESVAELVEEGQDVNGVDENKATPIVYAVAGGHLSLVPVLTVGGADPMARDGEGNSLFHVAAYCGRLEALQYLVEFLRSAGKLEDDDDWPSWTNAAGLTVLDVALRSGGEVADFVRSHAGPSSGDSGDLAAASGSQSSAATPAQPQSPAELAVLMLLQRMGPGAPRPSPEVVGQMLGLAGIAPAEDDLRRALQMVAGPDAPPPSPEQLAIAARAVAAAASEEVSTEAASVPVAPPVHAGGGNAQSSAATPAQPQSPAELAVLMLLQRMGPGAPRPSPEVVGQFLGLAGIAPAEDDLRRALQMAAGSDAPPPSPEQLATAARASAAAASEEVSAEAASAPVAPPVHAGGGSARSSARELVAVGAGGGGGAAARAVD